MGSVPKLCFFCAEHPVGYIPNGCGGVMCKQCWELPSMAAIERVRWRRLWWALAAKLARPERVHAVFGTEADVLAPYLWRAGSLPGSLPGQ